MFAASALAAVVLLAATVPTPADWEATLERVVPSVVSLKLSKTRGFDTETAGTSQATGFVVDAERGIILSNRHVVSPGPVVAQAIFKNREEVELRAIYRDPVHDFGFFQFDPEELRFMELSALPLAPEGAKVGVEIRVVGNDAGEKLSILEGTLARVDRDAPVYGVGRFNDFNTFYYQAASGTSGGSSGSPVVDVEGRVIALNAGGSSSAASSFYLPLDRVVRALELIQRGEPVPRGTVQATFRYTSYDELERLGLRAETEVEFRERFPDGTGLLVVQGDVPGGSAAGRLRVGDVVVRVDGQPMSGFLPLEEVLDASVGGEVVVEVERGGEPVEVTLQVDDLHSITPDEYLEVGGGVLNTVSYQMARTRMVPAAGVYVADSGFIFDQAGVERGSVIVAVGEQRVESLDDFEAVFSEFPDGGYVAVRFYSLKDPRRMRLHNVRVDRTWFPMRRCRRDDATGTWPCADSREPGAATPVEPVDFVFPAKDDKIARRLAPSLVQVTFQVPFKIDGVYGDRFVGTGLVVDAERGLVLVDRDTVPVALGIVEVVFAGVARVPGQVVWLHPVHNFALVRFDPAHVAGQVTEVVLDPTPLTMDDKVWVVGLDRSNTAQAHEARVTSIEPLYLPNGNPPRFKGGNADVVSVSDGTQLGSGALVDRRGRVRALWASYSYKSGTDDLAFNKGMPIAAVTSVLPAIRRGQSPVVRELGVELSGHTLAFARQLGLDDATLAEYAQQKDYLPGVLVVTARTGGTTAARLLEEGDILLSIDGRRILRMADVDAAVNKPQVTVVVLRDRARVSIRMPTVELDGRGTTRVALWGGLVLHEPHRSVAAQRGLRPQGLYVSLYHYGSPAQRYGVYATWRITEVDGVPTPDLDAFFAAVEGREDHSSLRLQVIDLANKTHVRTLRLDLANWPTRELTRTDEGWLRVDR